MTNERKKILFNYLKTAGFFVYFLILFCERVLALIFSVNQGGEYALSSGDPFNYVAYAVTAASLAVGTVLFVRLAVLTVRAIRSGERCAFGRMTTQWGVASVAMLFGGMMHTGYTLAWLQFIAYGFLIGAMIVRCVEACEGSDDRFDPIVSTIYLILFSMAIPVCYLSAMASPLSELFYVAEFAAVGALVPTFGIMLSRLMRTGATFFHPIFPAGMTLLSGATVAFKWSESINWFVLIFASLTLAFYLSFGIVALRREKRSVE